MKADQILSEGDWKNIESNCSFCTSEYLLTAINAAEEQWGITVITKEAIGGLSHLTIVKIAIRCIRKTNTCDKYGSLISIDPMGKFKITTNKKIVIRNLKVGTKLIWDAPPNFSKDHHTRIVYPVVIVQRHRCNPWVLMKSHIKAHWIGPTSEFLRYPTDEELKTLTWPTF